MSCFVCERMLQEGRMLSHLPSLVAAAAVFVTRTTLNRYPWSPTLVRYTKYSEGEVREVAREVVELASTPSTSSKILKKNSSACNTVVKKYSSSKYGQVATVPLDAGEEGEEVGEEEREN